jgi:predicted DNA-binding WGR domain protein
MYMACIRVRAGDEFTVIGKWGRRGKSNLQQQIKLTTGNEAAAIAEQRRLFEAKLKKNYVDIESSEYSGPLSMQSSEVSRNLEGPVKMAKKVPAPKKPTKIRPKPPEPEDLEIIVECRDNKGIEDKFDAGIEYVGEKHKDKKMVWVWDKLGEKQECFSDRFKVVPGV